MPVWETVVVSIIVAIISGGASWIASASQMRRDRADVAAKINDTYRELCAQLQARIAQLHEDIQKAEQRIEALECENGKLKEALAASIKERERLQGEVDDLSERLAAYENRPARAQRKAAQ